MYMYIKMNIIHMGDIANVRSGRGRWEKGGGEGKDDGQVEEKEAVGGTIHLSQMKPQLLVCMTVLYNFRQNQMVFSKLPIVVYVFV